MNKVILIGRLVTDNLTPFGESKAINFSVVTEEKIFSKTANKIVPIFKYVACTSFGEISNYICTNVAKGTLAIFTGSISNQSFVGKDGQKKWKQNVIVDSVEVVSCDSLADSKTKAGQYANNLVNSGATPEEIYDAYDPNNIFGF